MAEILSKRIKYTPRSPRIFSIDYTYIVRLDDPSTLGYLIKYLVESCQIHLILNNILQFRLSILITTKYIKNFGVPYSEVHNYNQIENRILWRAQSKKSLLGPKNLIKFKIKAIIWV